MQFYTASMGLEVKIQYKVMVWEVQSEMWI